MKSNLLLFAVITIGGSLAQRAQAAPPASPQSLEFFEKKIRPMLAANCYNCHSADTNAKGGLRVDDRNGLLIGGDRGSVVTPGHPEKSLLIAAVKHTDPNVKMPPNKQLTDEQIADLSQWIADGAAWPAEALPSNLLVNSERYDKLRKEHWAWQPLLASPAPQVQNAGWARDDIDRFVLAELEKKSVPPVGDADKTTLIRRASFDLTGLPPTPGEIDAFINDASPDAFAKVVDRLLASTAYGERWGRHWLDVARYGESTGSSRNVPYPQAFKYRDYVIDSFNHDKPYDQFIREQVAGDLLPADSQEQHDEHLVATGFLALGVKDVNQRFKIRFIMDNVDEQIDTVSRSVLALTASCARCHNHKFDPIPTSDYYALAGIFTSTDLCAGVRNKMGGGGLAYYDTDKLLHLGPPAKADPALEGKIAEAKQKLEEARKNFQRLQNSKEGDEPAPNGRPKKQVARNAMNRAQRELAAVNDPAADGHAALGVRDAQQVSDTEIRIRGEAERTGPTVPRGFLTVVQYENEPKVNPTQSGRLELAQWLTSPRNPLASRVIVNRVWQNLFGTGLVTSVDNFGVTGDHPSNPELLDHLAQRFVTEGWSIKTLIRQIVLSHTYQLGAEESKAAVAIDPENRLLWRHAPRRLEAEEIRDATLAVANKLSATHPTTAPAGPLPVVELPNNGPVAARIALQARNSTARSIYLPLLRTLTPTSLGVFDAAEQGMVSGSREVTTVATQALYLMNDPFVRTQSLNLAERLLQRGDLDDDARVQLAYRLTLGRIPGSDERELARVYLESYEAAAPQVAPTSPPASQPTTRPQPQLALADPSSEDGGPGGKAQAADDKPAAPEAGGKKAKAVEPPNPDEEIHADVVLDGSVAQPKSAREAAWASFCQAILGSAEFRYVR